jgi:hypothetical protein
MVYRRAGFVLPARGKGLDCLVKPGKDQEVNDFA